MSHRQSAFIPGSEPIPASIDSIEIRLRREMEQLMEEWNLLHEKARALETRCEEVQWQLMILQRRKFAHAANLVARRSAFDTGRPEIVFEL